MHSPTAADCQRLLLVQPLLDDLHRVDEYATVAALRLDVANDMELLLAASVAICEAGLNDVLSIIRADINARMPDAGMARDAALYAATAVAFADILDTDAVAALSLPWALAAVLYSDDELADLMLDTLNEED